MARVPAPWAILIAPTDAADRDKGGTPAASQAVTSGTAPVDAILQNPGGIGLRWAADDTLVFLSYRDGWPRLYSLPSSQTVLHISHNSDTTLTTLITAHGIYVCED